MQFFVPCNTRPEGTFTRNVVYRELLDADGLVPEPPIELPPLPEPERSSADDNNKRADDKKTGATTDSSTSDDGSDVSSCYSDSVPNPTITVTFSARCQRTER